METLRKLENEISDLRRILASKEAELSALKASLLPNVVPNGLPKWAIERYSRQLLLDEIGVEGQRRLCSGSVLIVGAGGLGSPAALYLAGAGIGHIGIVDYDTVDITNIHRQILHPEYSEGIAKVESAAQAIARINSKVHVTRYNTQLCAENALEIIRGYDVVLDASDNVVTRYLLNDACYLCRRPLVSGSALKMEGQLTVYDHRQNSTSAVSKCPCYRCLFPVPPRADAVASCSQAGVCGPVTGVIGSLQALEAVKIVVGGLDDRLMAGRMLVYDGCAATFRTVKLRSADPNCALCSPNATVCGLVNYELFCDAAASDKDLDLRVLSPDERLSAVNYANMVSGRRGSGDEKAPTEKTILVDVRSSSEFEMCRIPGSINRPIDEFSSRVNTVVADIMDTRPDIVVFVCRRGNDSQLAAKQFKEAVRSIAAQEDAPRVYDIVGGLHSWAKSVDTDFPVY